MDIWDAISQRGTEMKFVVGATLLQQGERTRHCYAIRAGEVLVTASSSQGSTLILARRGAGTIVGEQAALDGEPRSATVRAATDVSVAMLSAAALERLLRDEPELALAELRRLSRQLRELTQRFALQNEELRHRTVTILETNARETGDPVFRSTREELAGWVGCTREALIRELREMEDDGLVVLGRGTVELGGTLSPVTPIRS